MFERNNGMDYYVCSECGKRLDLHRQIVMKNDKVYCKLCYHRYTPTGISSTPLFEKGHTWKEEPSVWRSKIFPYLIVVLMLSLIALTILAPDVLRGFFFKDCAPNLKTWDCAATKPLYCDNGKIVNRSDICGCSDGFRKYQRTCVLIVNCTDGTLAPDCSSNKPYQCLNGTLIEQASICGCPDDYAPLNDTCKKNERCTADGTIYGQCSRNQPLFCDNGALVDRASVCGCPEGLVIESNGNTNGEKCVVSRVSTAPSSAPGSFASIYDAETKIHVLINAQRADNGLSALNFDEKLASVARKHSQDMAARNYFEHDTPEGQTFYDRMQLDGYSCAISIGNTIYQGAENIFEESGYSTDSIASTTVDGWMSSEGHRANILTSYWRNEGIGVTQSGSGTIYVTQDFC